MDDNTPNASRQAQILRERLIRTAYALHFAAADAALVPDGARDLVSLSSPVDHSLGSGSWRVVSDRAWDIVQAWEAGGDQKGATGRPINGRLDGDGLTTDEFAAEALDHLLNAGMQISALRMWSPGDEADLQSAESHIDAALRDIRRALAVAPRRSVEDA